MGRLAVSLRRVVVFIRVGLVQRASCRRATVGDDFLRGDGHWKASERLASASHAFSTSRSCLSAFGLIVGDDYEAQPSLLVSAELASIVRLLSSWVQRSCGDAALRCSRAGALRIPSRSSRTCSNRSTPISECFLIMRIPSVFRVSVPSCSAAALSIFHRLVAVFYRRRRHHRRRPSSSSPSSYRRRTVVCVCGASVGGLCG